MKDLWLIAHKCRGAATLDIAIKCEIAEEEAWIVASSGHRAYPYWQMAIQELQVWSPDMEGDDNRFLMDILPEMPEGLQDHFTAEKVRRKDLPKVDVLALLGIAKPEAAPKDFKRRI